MRNFVFLIIFAFLFSFQTSLRGADERPLYERLAYNRITLTPEEGGETFDILPMNFPNGEPPRPLPKVGEITIRFVDFPSEEYQINWAAIAKFESFNDLVFQELQLKQPILIRQINALPQNAPGAKKDDFPDEIQKSLNSLFGYYEYFEQSRNPPSGLEQMYREFLWAEAIYYSKVRKWIMAVTRLEQIYQTQRNFRGLAEQWNKTFNEILKETTSQKDYAQARAWIRHLESRFPESAIAKRWTTFYVNYANRLKEESLKASGQKNDLLAYEKIREAIDVYPAAPGLKEAAQSLYERFPCVVVGVSESAKGMNFDKNGAYRSFSPLPLSPHTRVQRLVSRSFVEQVGFHVEGGDYRSPFGTLLSEEQGQILKLRLNSDLAKTGSSDSSNSFDSPNSSDSFASSNSSDLSDSPNSSNLHSPSNLSNSSGLSDSLEPISGYEITESLMRFTDTTFNPVAFLWLNQIESFEMKDPEQITIRRFGPSVLPESLFRIPIDRIPIDQTSKETAAKISPRSGPYVFHSREILPSIVSNGELQTPKEKTTFLFNEQYTFPFENGPKMIQEQTIADTKEGLQLLTQGKICALERVAPWEVEKDANIAKEFIVGKYAIPSVHFLVPNQNRPLTSSRTFRRALLYGMNRQRILTQMLDGTPNAGTSNSGAVLLSGIAPRGEGTVDPIGYGYDSTINPRRYDPKLAVALCLITLTHARDRGELLESDRPKKARKQQLTDDVPEIVLAYPNNSASEFAVQAIRREWEAIGIPVELVHYSDDEPIGRGKRVDFWYVSCQIAEPMVDIPIIFSGEGLLGTSSAYMEIALNRLTAAKSWPEIAKALRDIHRISFEETTVLPLWMWKDCYVFRKDIQGANHNTLLNPLSSQSPSSNKSDLFHFYQSVEYWRIPFHYHY